MLVCNFVHLHCHVLLYDLKSVIKDCTAGVVFGPI